MKRLLSIFLVAGWAAAHASDKPNIILILADDLGYGDVGCYGGKLVPTPAIDSLARDGVRCTDGYVTAPVCAPSRCGLMTGAYNQRFGMQWNDDRRKYTVGQHKLLPQALRAAGYITGHIGKWNIPIEVTNCFDEIHDLIDWEADYFPDQQGHYVGVDSPTEFASSKVQGVWGPKRPGEEYLTDRLGRHAIEFIEKHKTQPFFLYLAFNAVHSPWHAMSTERERFAHLKDPPLNFYAAMLASLDENIGRVLGKLKAVGLERNTLMVFTSDNGPALGSSNIVVWPSDWPKRMLVGSAGPLNGWKAKFLEGGIREPFLLRWPAKLKAGATYRQPVSTMDLYPTFCAAAGAPVPAGTRLDGVNLLPHLLGENPGAPHDILFWKSGDQGAVRRGDWKLLLSSSAPKRQLFHLADDLGEQRDLAGEEPELVERLHQAWLDWSTPLPPRANPQTNHFYVAIEAKGASDENDGTRPVYQREKVGPWRTIQRALQAARPGDTVSVGNGRYLEELSIRTPRIQLRALSGARPLIDGENVRPYGIRNPDASAAEDVLIEGFEIANHTIAGVLISGRASRGVTIRGNIVHHARDKGIDVRGRGHRIESNRVFMIGNNQEAMGIHLASTSDCLVRDNDVFLCKKTAIRDQSGKRNTIEGNLMHQCWTGLDDNSCSGARAFNNFIYDNSQGFNPKHVKGDAGWNLFWHNTVYDSHGPHISIAVNKATDNQGPGPDLDYLDIRNNILVKAGHTHIWNKPEIVGDHFIIDHNLYFGPSGWPPFFYHTNWPGSGRPGMATLEEVRRKTSFERQGRCADPLLIDPEGGHLAYRETSPAMVGGAKLDSPFGTQLGARGVRKPFTRFVPVQLKAIKASVNENLMGNTADGRYCTGWHSGTETANQWIVYELEGAAAFTHLILVPVGHQVEFNVRHYEFSVSDDRQTWRRIAAGENNDSGSWFIYEFDRPVSARFLKFNLLDKFPDDGHTWTLNRLEFDELRAGRLVPPMFQKEQSGDRAGGNAEL